MQSLSQNRTNFSNFLDVCIDANWPYLKLLNRGWYVLKAKIAPRPVSDLDDGLYFMED